MIGLVGPRWTWDTDLYIGLRERLGVQVALIETFRQRVQRGATDGLDQLVPRPQQQPVRLSHLRCDRICCIPEAGILIEPDDGQVGIVHGQAHAGGRKHGVTPQLVGSAGDEFCFGPWDEPAAPFGDLGVALAVILPLRQRLGVLGLDADQARASAGAAVEDRRIEGGAVIAAVPCSGP